MAVTTPAVVNAEATLIPLPPPVPPVQLEKVTGPEPVKEDGKVTPWLEPVLLPEQFEKVTSPVVPGVQAAPMETPDDPDAEAVLAPLMVIVPDVLSMTLAELPAMLTPMFPFEPDADPVIEMLPLPVIVETVPAPPVMLTPSDPSELLGPPVPLRIIDPPPVVLTAADPARLIPIQVPVVPVCEAVI